MVTTQETDAHSPYRPATAHDNSPRSTHAQTDDRARAPGILVEVLVSVASGGVDHEGGVGGFAEARKQRAVFGERGSLRDVVAYLVAATA